ncbi:unnamed protein product [Adineta steineri]|uniref:EF-hand domain-containing protein n=1 Tax=Adineta steineri TaxID=433720 RepID=A0A814S5C9_9BILA|nr:unnamed protein product [Adineta steineri]CAF1178528.1 unnamed protein product [Adineta steineri]CAF1340550.1 unnamed protein product [Adineta steineri]CAF3535889.1 unnamed protein product [Adineta steineri]CAF3636438.1 unnamed protein product [Adineta steineri]
MGNKNGSHDTLLDETQDLLMQRTGMSKFDVELWYKAIYDRSTKGKLSKAQMISIYKDMSDLDSSRISDVVDSLANVFDEDHSGTVDINEFMRGFILTTRGDLRSKIDYTFRIYDKNDDNQISGEEIKQMANSITRMLGGDETGNDEACFAIIQQFLKQFTGSENGVIYKHDFIKTVMQNKELLAILSPFYACPSHRHH